MRPFTSRWLVAALLAFAWHMGAAQNTPNDGIDRNLLQRSQQDREFHVRLYDSLPVAGEGALAPLPPVPHSFGGPELYQPAGAGRAAPANGAAPTATGLERQQQLNDSQLRRQLELQTQNKFMDEPSRQQQSQIQQLQFGRENQALHLEQQIQRDSGSVMQRLR